MIISGNSSGQIKSKASQFIAHTPVMSATIINDIYIHLQMLYYCTQQNTGDTKFSKESETRRFPFELDYPLCSAESTCTAPQGAHQLFE